MEPTTDSLVPRPLSPRNGDREDGSSGGSPSSTRSVIEAKRPGNHLADTSIGDAASSNTPSLDNEKQSLVQEPTASDTASKTSPGETKSIVTQSEVSSTRDSNIPSHMSATTNTANGAANDSKRAAMEGSDTVLKRDQGPSTLEEWAAKATSAQDISTPPEPPQQSAQVSQNPITARSVSPSREITATPIPPPSHSYAEASNSLAARVATYTQPRPSVQSTATFASSATNPPYYPPPSVRYPSERMANRYYGSMTAKPHLEGVAFANLFRPEFLPTDLDPRLDYSSIWMGVDRHTFEAKYFVPASCAQCNATTKAQHCDRGYPTCNACVKSGQTCVVGRTWRLLKTAKRKSKSSVNGDLSIERAGASSTVAATISLPAVGEASTSAAIADEETGRGKRVKKKRRMDDELETITKSSQTATKIIPASAGWAVPETESSSNRGHKKPRPSLPAEGPTKDPPLSADDKAYLARLEVNAKKPSLRDMKSTCAVWAETRRALCSAAEYLRNPVRTAGASVEIGQGGVARGVILEGTSPSRSDYWGTGENVGTIIAAIGHSRPNRKYDAGVTDRPRSVEAPESIIAPDSPTIDVRHTVNGQGSKDARPDSPEKRSSEQPTPITRDSFEIEALKMACKFRSPVAIAVSHDYSETPFKVPRKFVVLGWFWIVDAWVQPVGIGAVGYNDLNVVWKFRFEWCEPQIIPWWSARSDPDRKPTPTLTWPYAKPLEPYQELRSDRPVCKPTESGDERDMDHCSACEMSSRRIYAAGPICLNEACRLFFRPGVPISAQLKTNIPGPILALERIAPESLGLKLRPDIPNGEGREGREFAGREWWRAWVCDICGMANERRKWEEWDCGACGQKVRLGRKIYDAFFLRNSSRPVCTGPRQDDGMPNWPFATTMGWTLFQDDIKVIRHGIDIPGGLGQGTELFHALSTESKMNHVIAGLVLRGLQEQGQKEVPFRRHVQPHTTNRPSERYLSPFYTILCGDQAPVLGHLPTGQPLPWTKAPQACIEAADLVNERAGRMWPGTKEFNSILVASYPPELPSGLLPRIIVEPNTYFSFLFLGSDGDLRFKQHGVAGKTGQLTYQHGDVIGLKSGNQPIEVSIKPDGFGFVCIGRRVYKHGTLEVADRDSDFPALQQPVSSSIPRPVPRSSIDASDFASSTPNLPAGKGKGKEKLLEKASIKGWYIGSRPLDADEPLRTLPTPEGRLHSQQTGQESVSERKWTNVVVIKQEERSIKTVSPIIPVMKIDSGTTVAKVKKPRKSKVEAVDMVSVAGTDPDGYVTMDVSPAKGKAKKAPAKKRASMASSVVGDGEEVSVDETMSVVSASTPRGGRGKAARGGRGRGRGRPSLNRVAQ